MKQCLDRRRHLRASIEPGDRGLFIDLDRFLDGVVDAYLGQVATAARSVDIGRDDAVEGTFLPSQSHQAKFDQFVLLSWRRCLLGEVALR